MSQHSETGNIQSPSVNNPVLRSYEIYSLKYNAVVRINSTIDNTSIDSNNIKSYLLSGNGFFIDNNYIVCPAHLVQTPPSLSKSNNIVPASRILVDVFNVNNRGHTYTYKAKLKTIDGAGDAAIIQIDFDDIFNRCCPNITKHPYFKWGDSRKQQCGDDVHIIGDFSMLRCNNGNLPSYGIVSGIIANNRHTDPSGNNLQEMIITDCHVSTASTGMPFINRYGEVVGMKIINSVVDSSCNGSGICELFLRPFIQSSMRIISTEINYSNGIYARFTVTNDSNNNEFYVYNKGYLGISYEVLTGQDIDTTIDINGSITGIAGTRYYDRNKVSSQHQNINKSNNDQNNFQHEIIGVRVVTVAGDVTTTYATVPGSNQSNLPPYNEVILDSPFKLHNGDIITHINDCPIGDNGKQIPPALFMWYTLPHDNITIRYFSREYNNEKSITGQAMLFPTHADYPWGAIGIFNVPSTEILPEVGYRSSF